MKGRLLILILVFFSYFYGNALAYLENYPPYKFENGPPDHLEAESLVDSDKKGYESKDGRVSVRLKETTDGLDFLVKEGENVLVHIKSKDTSMPYAIYRVDLDGNGLKDFIIFYNYRDWLTGIKEDKVEIFLKRNEGSYQKLSYDAITVGLEDFVDLDKDGKYEIIITNMYRVKKRNYFTYNIYEFKDYMLLNADAKLEGFPKFVRYTFNANDKDATNLTEEERLVHISKKDISIKQQETVSELKASSAPTSTGLDEEPVSSPKLSEFEEALAAKDREYQEVLEFKERELFEALSLKDEALEVLEDKEQEFKSKLEAKEREFGEALAAKDREYQEALEAKERELSDKEIVSLASVSEEKPLIKIGVVDIQRVIEESKKGREARRYYQGLVSLRSEEDLAMTEQELIAQIIKDIEIIVEEYARKEGFTQVMDMLEGGVVYAEESFDITDKIIELYDKLVESSEPKETE